MKKTAILIALALGIIATGSVLAIGEDQQTPASFEIRPAPSTKNFSTSGGDFCVTDKDSYFAAIFYNEPDWTDASSAFFRKNIDESWGDTEPAPGITADKAWSAKYEASFKIVSTNPPNPPPQLMNIVFYPYFAGDLKIFIDSDEVFNQTNYGNPKLFPPDKPVIIESANPHFIQVLYGADSSASPTLNPTLQLNAQWCDGADPSNPSDCTDFDYFFAKAGTGPSRPDELSYTKKPKGTSGSVNQTIQFFVDYTASNTTVPAIQWQKAVGSPVFQDIGVNSKTLDFGPLTAQDNGTLIRAQLGNDVCWFKDKISTGAVTVVSTPTPTTSPTPTLTPTPTPTTSPTPTPSPGALSCSSPPEVYINKEVIFTGTGGDKNQYKWDTNPPGSPEICNGLENPYTACSVYPKFETKWPNAGPKTVILRQSLLPDAECKVEVVDATPTPTPTITPTPTPTEEPQCFYFDDSSNTCKDPQKVVMMYAYEHSPIDPIDCGYDVKRFSTKEFTQECDPHPLDNPPTTIKGGYGLNWNDFLRVFAVDPSLTVQDSLPNDPDKSKFDYPSMFKNGVQDKSKVVQVGQLNAYANILNLLEDFSKNLWPPGPISDDSIMPKNLLLSGLDVVIGVTGGSWFDPMKDYIHFGSWDPIDKETIIHEFTHFLQKPLNIKIMYFYDENFEVGSLIEGMAQYFSMRGSDDSLMNYYSTHKEGWLIDMDAQDIEYPVLKFKKGGDPHILGNYLTKTLLVMRDHIKSVDPGSEGRNVRVFDQAVIVAYSRIQTNFAYETNRLSTYQLFYIDMYDYLRARIIDENFPSDLADYFRDEILYNQTKIGVLAGNATFLYAGSIMGKIACKIDPISKIRTSKYIFGPIAVNAIDSYVKSLEVEFRSINNELLAYKNFDLLEESKKLGMHSPNTILEYLFLDYAPQTATVHLIVTAENGKSNDEEVPGNAFLVDYSNCK